MHPADALSIRVSGTAAAQSAGTCSSMRVIGSADPKSASTGTGTGPVDRRLAPRAAKSDRTAKNDSASNCASGPLEAAAAVRR